MTNNASSTKIDSAARRIILENRYMTLATSTPNGLPWASPVAYAVDDKLNLFWYSGIEARHSINISENFNVSAAIFDSDVLFEEVDGVQIFGRASVVSNNELPLITGLYWAQCFPDPEERQARARPIEHFIDKAPQRFYRLDPLEIWKYDTTAEEMDRRIKAGPF